MRMIYNLDYHGHISVFFHWSQIRKLHCVEGRVQAFFNQLLPYILTDLLTFPLRPQWDIRPQQSFATRFCPWRRSKPHPTIAPSLSARPSLFVATSSLAVLASFFQVVSISVPHWGCYLRAFAGRVLAISAVGV